MHKFINLYINYISFNSFLSFMTKYACSLIKYYMPDQALNAAHNFIIMYTYMHLNTLSY